MSNAKKQTMNEQERGWEQYYTIPSQYDDFCEYFRKHTIIGKYFPSKEENFVAQMIFEFAKEEAPGWYLHISNYSKKVSYQFHVYKWSDHSWACVDMRRMKHGIFTRWTNWEEAG